MKRFFQLANKAKRKRGKAAGVYVGELIREVRTGAQVSEGVRGCQKADNTAGLERGRDMLVVISLIVIRLR